jgi:hypothetical protein
MARIASPVRSAVRLLADKYDQPVFGDRLDELCTLLIARVNELIDDASVPRRNP